jgi:prevent-host-death family protein
MSGAGPRLAFAQKKLYTYTMKTSRLGKSEARAQFLPLVESVAAGGAPIEITDRGKVAAVLLGHQEYLRLLALAHSRPASRSPVGTIEILTDLEADDAPAAMLLESLHRRSEAL